MLQVYRLYVGLSQANCSRTIDRDQVVNAVAKNIGSFTVYDAQGFFRGEQEDALIFTVAHESSNYIKSLAYDLCVLLHQDGIGLEYDGRYHRITRDCTTKDRPVYGLVSNLDGETRRDLS